MLLNSAVPTIFNFSEVSGGDIRKSVKKKIVPTNLPDQGEDPQRANTCRNFLLLDSEPAAGRLLCKQENQSCETFSTAEQRSRLKRKAGQNFTSRSFTSVETCSAVRNTRGMDLQEVVAVLKKMAPLSPAGSWDNVGLLVEPSPPHKVQKILLTNDLTPPVMQEALDGMINMIVSYHPPIFAPLKRITQGSWKERIVVKCLEYRIALYSPHTSWDAAADGVNDWLLKAFGDVTDVRPLEQTEEHKGRLSKKISFMISAAEAETITQTLQGIPNVEVCCEPMSGGGAGDTDRVKVSAVCEASTVVSILSELEKSGISSSGLQCQDLAKLPTLGFGMGRAGRLSVPVPLETILFRIKKHLGLEHVQLAKTDDKPEISTVAVCAGSGSSVLPGVKADLYLTGEMSHHEILDAVYRGTHVVVCNHSNTERGFLKVVQSRLTDVFKRRVEVKVSQMDKDPLTVV